MPLDPPVVNAGLNAESMAELLRTGTHSQKTVILFEVSQMRTQLMPETLPVIVHAICTTVKEWDEDLQIAAAEALLDISKECKESSQEIALTSLEVISRGSISEDIYESWGEILVRVLPNTPLQKTELNRELLDLLNLYAVDQSKLRRKLAARLFGSISSCLTSDQVEKDVLEQALKLADDRDIDVRGMLAESLAFVGAAASCQVTSNRVWPTIWGLLQDNDTRIRAVTLRAIANILDTHRKKGMNVLRFSKLLYPIFLKESSLAREVAMKDLCGIDDIAFVMLLILSQVFGQFAFSCAPHFSNETEKDAIFQTYRRMATCNSAGIRRYCAYNLPAVALIFGERHHAQLARVLLHLCGKGGPETRCILAAGIRETANMISKAGAGTPSIEVLFNVILQLLQDRNPLVQLSMSRNVLAVLPSLGTSLYPNCGESSKSRCDAIFRTLSTIVSGNWRAQEILVREIQYETSLVSSTAIKSYFLPLLYRLAEESPYQVRKCAMKAIAKAIWYLPLTHMRVDVMRSFRIEWGESGVYWMRLAFIECGEAAMGLYSSSLLNELFVDTLLHLADDPVPNVRMRLAKIMPTLALFCYESPTFQNVISSLKLDLDIDVQECMSGIDGNIERLEEIKRSFEEEDLSRVLSETRMAEKASKQVLDENNSNAVSGDSQLNNATEDESRCKRSVFDGRGPSSFSSTQRKTFAKLGLGLANDSSLNKRYTELNSDGQKIEIGNNEDMESLEYVRQARSNRSPKFRGVSKLKGKIAECGISDERADIDEISSPVTPTAPWSAFDFNQGQSKGEGQESEKRLNKKKSFRFKKLTQPNADSVDNLDGERSPRRLSQKLDYSRLSPKKLDAELTDDTGKGSISRRKKSFRPPRLPSGGTSMEQAQIEETFSPSSSPKWENDKAENECTKAMTSKFSSLQTMWRQVKKASNRSE